MPEWFFDWWGVIGAVAGVVCAYFAWRSWGSRKTTNSVVGGNNNTQKGGAGVTHNQVRDGDGNNQSG